MPNLYVTEPVTLHKHSDAKENKIYPGINLLSIDKSSVPSSPNNEFLQNATINSDKTSHEFHTYGNGPNGCVQICHTQKQKWDASKTCVGVFFKGILWVTAYTVHLETGDSIANVLQNWGKA